MSASADGVRSGLDLRWVDSATRAQDDLFGHVNGGWLATEDIPDDRAQHGMLRSLRDDAEADVRAIVVELADGGGQGGSAPGGDDRRVGDLYTSFLDTDAIEASGTDPVRPLMDEIAEASDRAALAEVLGRRQREGLVGLVWASVATYVRDSSRPLVHLSQAGLGLPDGSYYSDEGDAGVLDRYREHLVRLAELVELPDPEALAASVLDLETALSRAWMDPVSVRDPEKVNNLMTWAELRAQAPGFDWTAWLGGLGVEEKVVAEVVVGQPGFLAEVGRLWTERPLEQWKAWLTMRLVSACAQYLGRDLAGADFDFHGRVMSGVPDQPERWRRGLGLLDAVLGDAVGRLYVARHFSASARARALDLVENLVEAFRRSLSDLDWMGDETRRRALDKLGRLTAKIGYPDRWKDYSSLDIRADDLLGNVRRAGAWRTGHDLAKVGRPVDRDEWLTTPQTVNAFYNPRLNEVVFPAAVLRPPLFDPGADDAANYGGIGSTIGHEIGHGFDDQGSQYDGEGNLVDWWEPADRAEFERRAEALRAQFDSLSPAGLPGHTVNGALTLGENIGDLGGMIIALRAYRLAVTRTGAAQPPVLDGLTGEQRVFFAYAGVWRAKTREAEAIRRLASDPHAPPDLRCNAVATNLDAFHDAFDVTETDALFTPETQRVRIW
ncbi:M13 family metallopeptidase [Pseudonocardia spinosispora]|uniref:M13 family metallopeptidase n=1 Tax=Pseudonocardia spinosispora TaxID=103441 RepID=UPI000419367F|nr:M13-type metalloendopeptidase [Pseudonocardia spinosispora]